jgi:hypothetical protein
MSRGARLRIEDVGRLGTAAQAQIRAALAERASTPTPGIERPAASAGLRLRQARGNTMNKTEAAFAAYLASVYPDAQVEREGITLRLANGVRYTPDFCVFNPGGDVVFYEVKGFMRDDAAVKVKVAAGKFPRASFWLVTAIDRNRSAWRIDRVFP